MKSSWSLWSYFPRAFAYARPYWLLGVLSLSLTGLTAVFALAQPWPLAIMVDNVLGDRSPPGLLGRFIDPGDKYALLIFAAAAGFALTLVGNGLTVLSNYVNTKLNQRMVLDLRSDLFDHCQRLSLTFHDARRTGELMARINQTAASVGTIVMTVPPLLQSAITLMGMFAITYAIDAQLALLSLTVVPFLYYSLGLYGSRIVPRLQRVQGLEWRSLSIVNEAMSMLRVIVSFGRERYEHERFRSQAETAVDARVDLTVRQTIFSLGVNTVTAAGTGLVFGLGAYKALNGELTVGLLLVLMSYIASIYKPLESISNTVGMMNDQLVQLRGSLSLLDTEPEVKEAPDVVDIGRAAGAVEFEHVGFAYKGRKDTLNDVSFAVERGERVAIVGPTGAGKTTLVSLLVRFYDVHEGRIVIDGVDIRKMTLESLRRQISVVHQEPMLFSGTIAENIRYGRLEASMEEVIQAARAANAHDFISALPDGYETELGEKGAQLSGGERQRVCVARAFLKDAPILVLDEPTSSIDSKTEAVILDSLDSLMEGRTSFMIAHRLSTIRSADLILVLSHGRLVEQGTHEELLAREGLYRQLYDAQTRERVRKAQAKRTVRAELMERLGRALDRSDDAVIEEIRTVLEANGDGDGTRRPSDKPVQLRRDLGENE